MGPRTAKLSQPSVTGCYPRTRLFDQLDDARDRPGVWVTGPAGSGKTTLAASYVAARGLPCLWYTLDAGDADPATWFSYLGLAARGLAGEAAELPALAPEYLPGLPTFTRNFFETLCAGLPVPSVLVFDDYQDLGGEAPVHALLVEALAMVPEGITVIVLSREEPPPVMARLRANRSVATLDGEALRLTADEAAGVARVLLQGRKAADPAALHQAADGWVAGLVLLLERAQGGDWDADALARMDRTVLFDYIAAEVFERESEAVRNLLLATADPARFSETVAIALSGQADAGEALARLVRNGYFTYRSAGDPPDYRYHPLLREFLLAQVGRTLDDAARNTLRRTAATALAADGQIDDAARLAIEADDPELLARLILENAQGMVMAGRFGVLEGWLRTLPEAPFKEDPWLNYWLGISRLPFTPQDSRPHFERAYSLSEAAGDPVGMWLAIAGAADSFVLAYDRFIDYDPWIARMESVADGHPELMELDVVGRALASAVGPVIFRQPDHPRLHEWAGRLQWVTEAAKDPVARIFAAQNLLHLYSWVGRLREMEGLLERIRPLVAAPGIPPIVQVYWHVFEAILGWITGRFDHCEAAVAEGVALSKRYGMTVHPYLVLTQGVHVSMDAGDVATVRAKVAEIRRQLLPNPGNLALSHILNYEVWCALESGDVPVALACAEETLDRTLMAGTPFPEALASIGMADARWLTGETARAKAHLARAREVAVGMDSPFLLFAAHVSAAEGWRLNGRLDSSLEALAAAFSIGRQVDLQSHFWWRPAVMRRLCALALKHGIEPEYTRKLIRVRGLLPHEPPLSEDGWEWQVAVRTLGGFAVKVNGAPLRFSGKTQRRPLDLLKALIALGDGAKPVAVSRLTDALWPDAEGDAANQAFRAALSRLRKLVGADAVVTADGQVQLDPRRCWVDAWALQRLSREGDGCAPETVSGLYQGPFLPEDDTSAPWMVFRETLRDTHRREAFRIGRRLSAAGDLEGVVTLLEAALEADPDWQGGCRELVCAHAALGDLERARAAHGLCVRALEAAGEAPTPAFEAFHQALARSEGMPPPFS